MLTQERCFPMENSKPEPLLVAPSLGTVCPICGKKSYSAAGIHPQCAMQQADAPRQAFLAAEKKRKKDAADAEKLSGVAGPTAREIGYSKPKTPR